MTDTIPSPRSWPLIGNALEINAEFPMTSLSNLAKRYGEQRGGGSGLYEPT